MADHRKAPLSLMIVATLFALNGLYSVATTVFTLANGRVRIELGILGLFIGFGLVRFSRGWRTCALVFLWIAMIASPMIAVVCMFQPSPLPLKLFNQQVGHVPRFVGVNFVAIIFIVSCWQCWVLTRPRIRDLFGLSGEPS